MSLRDEVSEIPAAARRAMEATHGLELPRLMVGMGSSYYAGLSLWAAGHDCTPVAATDLHRRHTEFGATMPETATLISQSGGTSEVLWIADLVASTVAVTNGGDSALATHENVSAVIDVVAGDEEYSSTKSWINTLIALWRAVGWDVEPVVDALATSAVACQQFARTAADQIADYERSREASLGVSGRYVIGSGPNYATARQSALTLSETTKRIWTGAELGEYDHGLKETANDSVVVILRDGGSTDLRAAELAQLLRERSTALVVELVANEVGGPDDVRLTPATLFQAISWLMAELEDRWQPGEPFVLGGKVTTVT